MKRTKVQCKDDSWTLYNHEVQEAYHTPLGAALESREKFVGALNIKELAKQEQVVILDVCFGLGYNSAACIEALLKENPSCNIKVVGLEIDETIVADITSIPFPFKGEERFFSLANNYDKEKKEYNYTDEQISIRVNIGDAKETIKQINIQSNIVFFDPFSPKKAPTLWAKEFMKDVHNNCADKAILVTYSCARMVRDNLAAAGFSVEDGPVVGRRGPATIGRAKHS